MQVLNVAGFEKRVLYVGSIFSRAGDLTAIPGALQLEPAIVHAFEIANKCGLSPAELDAQDRREIFIQDQRGAIALAEQRERLRIAEGFLD